MLWTALIGAIDSMDICYWIAWIDSVHCVHRSVALILTAFLFFLTVEMFILSSVDNEHIDLEQFCVARGGGT